MTKGLQSKLLDGQNRCGRDHNVVCIPELPASPSVTGLPAIEPVAAAVQTREL